MNISSKPGGIPASGNVSYVDVEPFMKFFG